MGFAYISKRELACVEARQGYESVPLVKPLCIPKSGVFLFQRSESVSNCHGSR